MGSKSKDKCKEMVIIRINANKQEMDCQQISSQGRIIRLVSKTTITFSLRTVMLTFKDQMDGNK
jgi:hypothetical protein